MDKFFKIRDLKIYNQKAFKDIKISSFADVHLSHLVSSKKLSCITDKVLEFNPDYICIAGDLLDYLNILEETKYLDILRSWLSDISSIPVLISLGSHDMGYQVSKSVNKDGWVCGEYERTFKILEESLDNVYVLDNKNYQDDRLFVSGYAQTFEYAYSKEDFEAANLLGEDLSKQEFLLRRELNVPAISLIHDPIYLTEPQIVELLKNYDFILSGHMHNGIVPPILDELWKSNLGLMRPNKKLLAPNARGVIPIKLENKIIYLVVTSGIIKIQETAPKILQPFNHLFPSGIDNITITNDSTCEQPKVKSYYRF